MINPHPVIIHHQQYTSDSLVAGVLIRSRMINHWFIHFFYLFMECINIIENNQYSRNVAWGGGGHVPWVLGTSGHQHASVYRQWLGHPI